MPSASVTSKGQITIPREIRERLGLRPGDRLAFRLHDDGTVSVEPETIDPLTLFGSVKTRVRGVTLEAMNEAVRKAGSRR